MKKIKLLSLLLVIACLFTVACDTPVNSSLSGDSSSNFVDSSSSSNENEDRPIGEGYEIITVAEALELCGEAGNVTTERYYLLVTVDTVTNAEYGEMTVSDSTGSIYVYGAYSADGELTYAQMEDKPVKGDLVLLHCILQNYNGTKEVKNARIIDFEHVQVEDDGEYQKMSVMQARNAEVGTKVQVSGVVCAITYANGMKPSGVYVADNSGSIYIYSTDIAQNVEKGNKITVNATKTYWILDSEKENAEKHGYNGCNQLESATLVENDNEVNQYNKEWIEQSSVKEILETPVSEDITTLIYKVNALVKKVEGTGFTNYYFYDLDGETGAYVYTQCSGGDFAWLDQFDGKICTVYLSVINAKSSASACFFRFFPVEVIDENFTFDANDVAKFVVEYYGVKGFQSTYNKNPQAQLINKVSSELLGFENATLTYSSDNDNVATFENGADFATFNLVNYGSANVTVTGEYNGVTYSQTITVNFEKAENYSYITVAEAIATAPNTDQSEVTVKGIVGPSVVNKDGFYLFGEDGSVIAVLVNSTEQFANISIGNEVILKGTRERYIDDDSKTIAGQTCLVDAQILVNNYGTHQYSTQKFVTDATGEDFYNLDATVDYSTTIFVLTGKISVVKTPHYTSLEFYAEDGTKLGVYSSSANQYSFLFDYSDQMLTYEIAACNWNNRSYWRVCILSVTLEDGTKIYNTLNFDINS